MAILFKLTGFKVDGHNTEKLMTHRKIDLSCVVNHLLKDKTNQTADQYCCAGLVIFFMCHNSLLSRNRKTGFELCRH